MENNEELTLSINEKLEELAQCSNGVIITEGYEPGQWLNNDAIVALVRVMDKVDIDVAFKLVSIDDPIATITIYELYRQHTILEKNVKIPKDVLSLFTICDKPDWVDE